MVVIERDRDVHTMVVTFTVSGEDEQRALVEHLNEVAADHSKQDGFVSVSILASVDGVRVTEYIQWETAAHMRAVMSTPAGQAHVNDPRLVADAHPYRVAHVWERADWPAQA